jgi:hypothetical protein
MMLKSFFFAYFPIGYVCNRFSRQLILDILSCWWQESLIIVISVCACFLYIANYSFVSSRYIVGSRKLTELCSSFSVVNFMPVCCL